MDSGITHDELEELKARGHRILMVGDDTDFVSTTQADRLAEEPMPPDLREFDDQDRKRQFLDRKHKVKGVLKWK